MRRVDVAGVFALGDLQRHVVAEVFGDRQVHRRGLGLADLLQDGVAGNLVVFRRDGLHFLDGASLIGSLELAACEAAGCAARAALAASARLAPVCVAICARGGAGVTGGAGATDRLRWRGGTCAAAFARLAPVCVEICDGGAAGGATVAARPSPRLSGSRRVCPSRASRRPARRARRAAAPPSRWRAA